METGQIIELVEPICIGLVFLGVAAGVFFFLRDIVRTMRNKKK